MARQSIGFERGLREGEDEEAIRRLFTPEFRNRLDSTIAFAHLTPEIMMRIVDKFLLQLEAQLQDRNVEIAATDAARRWLGEKGYDRAFGARPLGPRHPGTRQAADVRGGAVRQARERRTGHRGRGGRRDRFRVRGARASPGVREGETERVQGAGAGRVTASPVRVSVP